MNHMNMNTKRTPFWGTCILNTTGNLSERCVLKEKEEKESQIYLARLYEMVDDYVEQA